jgi:4a-hydroxytetrahydrobiopterin dehydratase
MPDIISKDDLKRLLKKIPEWEVEGKAITRTIEFDDFQESVEFVNDLADIAADVDHQPDVDIRYNKVTLYLTTHEAGGVTDADIELAQLVDNLVD